MPKCPLCEGEMKKKHEGVYVCTKCKGVFVSKDAQEVVKSCFGVT